MLKNIESLADIRASFRVFTHLRPHLKEDAFVDQVQRQMQQGYIISAIYEDEQIASAIGYRYLEALAWGKYIYIDDLITHPTARGKGSGAQLLSHVKSLAIAKGLDGVHLDSGHTRFDAHRLYLNQEYQIVAHHFQLILA